MRTLWNDWFGTMDYPFLAFDDLRQELDRMLEAYDRGAVARSPQRAHTGPKVDLADSGTTLTLRAELPGLTKEDVHIELDESTVTLSGLRKDDAPQGYNAHRRERGAFQFTRSFGLPVRVDPERTSARIDNGVLVLTMEKTQESQPRQITVKGN